MGGERRRGRGFLCGILGDELIWPLPACYVLGLRVGHKTCYDSGNKKSSWAGSVNECWLSFLLIKGDCYYERQ
jgi:hypothetical protein